MLALFISHIFGQNLGSPNRRLEIPQSVSPLMIEYFSEIRDPAIVVQSSPETGDEVGDAAVAVVAVGVDCGIVGSAGADSAA